MNNQWNRLIITAGTLFSLATVATVATPANAADDEGATVMEIPTRLSNEPTFEEQDGTCSVCSVDYLRLDRDESDQEVAVFQLYFEDNGESEVAGVWLKVLLCDGRYRLVMMPSMNLAHGSLNDLEAPSGEDWSWENACYVWVGVD